MLVSAYPVLTGYALSKEESEKKSGIKMFRIHHKSEKSLLVQNLPQKEVRHLMTPTPCSKVNDVLYSFGENMINLQLTK